MNEPGARSLRNVAVIGNRGAGKTSLAEAILLTTGGIPTLGSVMQGTTASDFEPEEIHHRCSVSTSLLRCSWNHTTINLLDTPGALSLLGEAITALQAADAVIVVLNPASGIRSELLRLWSQVKALGLPCLIFVNELEKESGSTEELLAACHRDVDLTPLPMSCALKDGAQWIGVLDFVNQAAVHSRPDTAKWQQQPVPPGAEAAPAAVAATSSRGGSTARISAACRPRRERFASTPTSCGRRLAAIGRSGRTSSSTRM